MHLQSLSDDWCDDDNVVIFPIHLIHLHPVDYRCHYSVWGMEGAGTSV